MSPRCNRCGSDYPHGQLHRHLDRCSNRSGSIGGNLPLECQPPQAQIETLTYMLRESQRKATFLYEQIKQHGMHASGCEGMVRKDACTCWLASALRWRP
mgnify:CR=1 FL=1